MRNSALGVAERVGELTDVHFLNQFIGNVDLPAQKTVYGIVALVLFGYCIKVLIDEGKKPF